jgi:hypothetical protein
MNHDEIIRIAKEAGYVELANDDSAMYPGDFFERFAALVAAAERERCILILERLHERSGGQYNYYLHAAKVLKGEI